MAVLLLKPSNLTTPYYTITTKCRRIWKQCNVKRQWWLGKTDATVV